MKRLLSLCLSAGLLTLLPGAIQAQGTTKAPEKPATFQEVPATRALIDALREGGYVIYMRHGKTDNSRPDQLTIDYNDCNTQRPLAEEGRRIAAEVGKAMRTAGIPIGEIFSSPMCRARESAQAAFGKSVTVVNDLYSSTNQTSAQKVPVIAATQRLLSQAVSAGTNRVVVAHAPNLFDTMKYFPPVESTVVIIKPRGNQFEYLASIRPDDWPALLK